MQLFFFLLLFLPLYSMAETADPNILVYEQGTTEIDVQINAYENLIAYAPIIGTILITHNHNNTVDPDSFQIGNKALKVKFIQSTAMSPYSKLEVSVFSFQLEGMNAGNHTLPPIKAKVGGKYFETQPLMIQISASSSS